MKTGQINSLTITEPSPVFIIAEAGCNHNGDINLAKRLVDVAVETGADAVKFQTFVTDKLVTRHVKKADYQKKNTANKKESQSAMLKKLELNREAHKELISHCNKRGIQFLSSPFDLESIDFFRVRT